jgi:class 3 adenylate cyclase
MSTQKSRPSLSAYLPIDRRHALATRHTLPDRVEGTALLADIAGFTPLADTLVASLGPQRGAEELTRLLNTVYDALIAQVHRYAGSVVSFVGDGLMCWFDEDTGSRATACGLQMQQAMVPFATTSPMESEQVSLSIKCGVATGSARRFLVGQPHVDLLAGATLDRVAQAEQIAQRGEVVVAPEIVQALGDRLNLGEKRDGFAVVAGRADETPPTP